ncbi:helix-turn-helix transcriptional regulator [Enterococcus sp. BWB1-3]|uniref:helix-turn-helix domain-containing protein n=1 Tax=Enterococcus sp. BWB1-3 TaxID=2787713 RepID=UPI001922192A|nr:helix-turn-helix transcriptional regulator [Enterococcus sp. BWB1-3]MBL1227888.1 helix-turn-helix transcriptional regulator [Enterococcus sp. BWB1-3]
MELNEKLKSQRIAMGFTQQEVADKVFVTRQTISKWELGKSRPDLVSLKLLNELLQTDYLKTEEGKENYEMNITIKDIFLTFLFGVLFLPIRWVVSFLHPKRNWVSVKLGLIPIVLIFLFCICDL